MGLPGDYPVHKHMCTGRAQVPGPGAKPAYGIGWPGAVMAASHHREHQARAATALSVGRPPIRPRSPCGGRHPEGARRVMSLLAPGTRSRAFFVRSRDVIGRVPRGDRVRRRAAMRDARSDNTASRSRIPQRTSSCLVGAAMVLPSVTFRQGALRWPTIPAPATLRPVAGPSKPCA